jgi:hypothetical protein
MAKEKKDNTNVEKKTENKTETISLDKALKEVVFVRRWMKPDNTIAEIGDRMSIDKQTFDTLIKHGIAKEI